MPPKKRDESAAVATPADAAAERSDYHRALILEREQVLAAGKADRAKAIDAEIKRITSAPQGRSSAPADEI